MSRFLQTYPVPIAFILLCAVFLPYANLTVPFALDEITTRLARNLLLTLSLVVPVVAGLGLNFGIVLGAMAGQGALILVRAWHIGGFPGFLLAAVIATPAAIVLGWLVGRLLNRAKGREMITGIIASFFANGVYSLIFLFAVGGGPLFVASAKTNPLPAAVLIVVVAGVLWMVLRGDEAPKSTPSTTAALSGPPAGVRIGFFAACLVLLAVNLFGLLYINDQEIVLPQKFGVRTSVNLDWGVGTKEGGQLSGALDDLLAVKVDLTERIKKDGPQVEYIEQKRTWKIPAANFALALLVCFAIHFLLGTKLGQEMRSLGQDMHIAGVLGIEVDRTRILAIIISTVLAAWGQMVFLQNMGTINVYSSHEQVGMLAVAALLIGGASAAEAKIAHALIGTLLLHLLMLVSARAGPNIFPKTASGEAQLGEYLRSCVAYGVIALALALHAYKEARRKDREREEH